MTNFKITKDGHFVTESNIFVSKWNLKVGIAHIAYDKHDGPVIQAESEDPATISKAAYAWVELQKQIEEDRKNNDPAYLREQVQNLTNRMNRAESQVNLLNALPFNELSPDVQAILAGYTSNKERVKIETRKAKEAAKVLAKKYATEKKLKIKDARKKVGNKEAIVYRAEWLEYLNGNGHAYRGSRVCKSYTVSKITADVVITETGKVYVDGLGKLKLNLSNYETGEVIRRDYDI